ncbi:hypothetical protein TNCV_2262851 [Trichonephila clavipes]|nr:hypothetical protein TNCV_2262851 [Trichonephila clavipes]
MGLNSLTILLYGLVHVIENILLGNLEALPTISLSQNTIAERVTDLAVNLSDQIKAESSFESSIACDKSADIGGIAQLPMFLFVPATRILTFLRNYWN